MALGGKNEYWYMVSPQETQDNRWVLELPIGRHGFHSFCLFTHSGSLASYSIPRKKADIGSPFMSPSSCNLTCKRKEEGELAVLALLFSLPHSNVCVWPFKYLLIIEYPCLLIYLPYLSSLSVLALRMEQTIFYKWSHIEESTAWELLFCTLWSYFGVGHCLILIGNSEVNLYVLK
jgi:hypothetical protein